MHDTARPAGAVRRRAFSVAAAGAEDREGISGFCGGRAGTRGFGVVGVDGEADVVGHEADGEGVEEGFEEGEAGGDY